MLLPLAACHCTTISNDFILGDLRTHGQTQAFIVKDWLDPLPSDVHSVHWLLISNSHANVILIQQSLHMRDDILPQPPSPSTSLHLETFSPPSACGHLGFVVNWISSSSPVKIWN